MVDPFLGDIILFAGNFAPRGWALCDGQLLSISSNQALFSLLGTNYGGDGRTTFGLPDLRGRFPLHPGQGPGLPPYRLGQKTGETRQTLNDTNVQAHTHTMKPRCSFSGGTATTPAGNYHGVSASDDPPPEYSSTHDASMAVQETEAVGGSSSFSMQNPYVGVHFVIALVGTYPSRN